MDGEIFSSVASPNIAFIKYWGKRGNTAKTPVNDSVSMTLDSSVLRTETTLFISKSLKRDAFVLNGEAREDASFEEAISLLRKRLSKKGFSKDKKVLVVSQNNFPTASGIASSASGFAALAEALAAAFKITDSREKSILARLGSGSACRSVFGGFVRWQKGEKEDGEDSFAVEVAPKSHWPEMTDVLAITSRERKKVGSRSGMKQTIATSTLFKARVESLSKRIPKLLNAINEKDFEALALNIMQDSNNMHATMLDTWPPILYLNDVSKRVIFAVEEFNEKETRAAYTFDAGPNAHVITLAQNAGEVKKMLLEVEGVQDVIVSPVGDGSRLVSADKKLVEKTLSEVKL